MVGCAHCLSENRTLICSGCYCAFYCDSDCERAHWHIHKKWCRVLGERMSVALNTYIQSQYVGMKRSGGSSIPSGGNPPPEKRKLTEKDVESARAADAAITTATADAASATSSAAAAAATASMGTPESAAAGNVLQGLPKELSEIYRPGVLFSITNADRILSLMHKTQVETKGSIQGTPAVEMIHQLLGKETPFMVRDGNVVSLWMLKDGLIQRGDTPVVTLPEEVDKRKMEFPFTNICLFNYDEEGGGLLAYNMLSGKTKTEPFPGSIGTYCVCKGVAFIGRGSEHAVTMLYPSASKDALISNTWKPETSIQPVVMNGCSGFVAFTEEKISKKWFLNKLDKSGIPEEKTGKELSLPGVSYFVAMEDQQNTYMFLTMKKSDYYPGTLGLSTYMNHKLTVTTETMQYSFHVDDKIYIHALKTGILMRHIKERIDVSREADMHSKLKKNTRLRILVSCIPSKKYVEDAARDAGDSDSEDYKPIDWIPTEFTIDYGLRDEIEIEYVFWDTIAVYVENTGILWVTRTYYNVSSSSSMNEKLSLAVSDTSEYVVNKIVGISRKNRIAAVSFYGTKGSKRKWYILFDTLSGREITRTRDLQEIYPIMFYATS